MTRWPEMTPETLFAVQLSSMFDLLGGSGARAHPICLGVKEGEHPEQVTSVSESHI